MYAVRTFNFVSTSLAYTNHTLKQRKTKISWDEKINFNINMEHQLWPILQKAFICDKTRQCFIWSLIQSYVYRLYPFLCISTLSSPMYIDFIPAPLPTPVKRIFLPLLKTVIRLRDSRFGWVTVIVTFVRVCWSTLCSLFSDRFIQTRCYHDGE